MDRETYEGTTEKDFIGRKAQTIIPLSNGFCTIPAGTIWTIRRKSRGFELLSDLCLRCGIQVRISKVPPMDVELLFGGKLEGINPRTLRRCAKSHFSSGGSPTRLERWKRLAKVA